MTVRTIPSRKSIIPAGGASPKRGGFTLFEVVISITIMTIVVLIIGHGFRLGMNAWKKGENESGWTQKFRVLSGLFTQQIKSAYPYLMDVEDEKVVLFKGASDSLLFATTLSDPPYGGVKWVRYTHKDRTLFIKEGFLPDKELLDVIDDDEEIIDSDIEEFELSYLSAEEGTDWSDSWDYADTLPRAVRIKISYFDPFIITIPMARDKEDLEREI